MQVAGGGAGPVGRRTQGSLERILREREQQQAQAPPAPQPLGNDPSEAQQAIHAFRSGAIDRDTLQNYFAIKAKGESQGSLLDQMASPGNALIDFASNTYSGLDNFVRNLPSTIGNTADQAFSGELGTPMDVAKGMGQSYLDYYTDPEAILADPSRALLDVAGAAGAAANIPNSLSTLDDIAMTGRLAVTPSLGETAVANDLRAITPFGKKLEALAATDEGVSGVRNATMGWGDDVPGIVPSAEPFYNELGQLEGYRPRGSASPPNMGVVDLPSGESGFSLLKPGGPESRLGINQVDPELWYQELNRRMAERLGYDPVRMPGSARADFDYANVEVNASPAGAPGPMRYESSVGPELHPTNGLAMEYVPESRMANPGEMLNPENADAAQRMTLMDYLAGNTDRDFATGHNVMVDPEGPFAIDQGLAGRSASDFHQPAPAGAVPSGWTGNNPSGSIVWTGAEPSPAQWPGYVLSPEHQNILNTGLEVLRAAEDNPNDLLWQLADDGYNIEGAISRAENALQRGKLFGEHPYLAQGGQGQTAFHPNGMQAIWNAIQQSPGSESGSMNGLEFNPAFADDLPTTEPSIGPSFWDNMPEGEGVGGQLQAILQRLRDMGIQW